MIKGLQGTMPHHERKDSYHNFRRLYEAKFGRSFPRIVFNLDDRGSTAWPVVKEHSMTYRSDSPERKDFCGPDWTFWHWPSSGIRHSPDTFEEILRAGDRIPKDERVAWFGNIKSAGPGAPESRTRSMLVNHFAKKYPRRFEFQNAGRGAGVKFYVSLPDMVRKYKYLIDIGGAGYSGRTKFLMFSGRPLLMVDRHYVEYFSDELKPYEHFIPVKMDLSDLLSQDEWMRSHPRESERIAENARQYAIDNFKMEKVLDRLDEVFKNFIRTSDDQS